MRRLKAEEEKLLASIHKCKEEHKYYANSPEYPCPWCEAAKSNPEVIFKLNDMLVKNHSLTFGIKEKVTDWDSVIDKLDVIINEWKAKTEQCTCLMDVRGYAMGEEWVKCPVHKPKGRTVKVLRDC